MPVPGGHGAVSRHLLRDDAYVALRAAIVTGELEPGERLHDEELCGWLGLSRTPVREALSRLSDEGLVEVAPQRHTRVTWLTARDAQDAFPVLASVHALATELAVPELQHGDVERLTLLNRDYARAITEGCAVAAYSADDAFHAVFVAGCGNDEVERVLARIAPRLRRLELLRDDVLPQRRSIARHGVIIGLAERGDATGAAVAVRDDWLAMGAVVERSLTAYAGGGAEPASRRTCSA